MIAGDGRTMEFDLLDRVTKVTGSPGTATEFAYAPDGARYRQVVTTPQGGYGPRTVYQLDKDYELTVWGPTGSETAWKVEERSYLGALVVYREDGGPREERYLHLDRLGSLDAVTDEAGAERLDGSGVAVDAHGYDAFGAPRSRDWRDAAVLHPGGDARVTTDRGFTGHEHLDAVALIHMNGRVYDYRLGRFLSVDPIISEPTGSQGINPYSYVMNNPFAATDPTGFRPRSDLKGWDFSLHAAGPWEDPTKQEQGVEVPQRSGATGFGASNGPTETMDVGGPAEAGKQDEKGLVRRGADALVENTIGKVVDAVADSPAARLISHSNDDSSAGAHRARVDAFVAEGNNRTGKIVADVAEVAIDVGTTMAAVDTGFSVIRLVRSALSGLKGLLGFAEGRAVAARWTLGGGKSATTWRNQMAKRGWNQKQIGEALGTKGIPVRNAVNPGNPATRHVHPETGRSLVIDNKTNEIIHVGGKNFDYSDWDL